MSRPSDAPDRPARADIDLAIAAADAAFAEVRAAKTTLEPHPLVAMLLNMRAH